MYQIRIGVQYIYVHVTLSLFGPNALERVFVDCFGALTGINTTRHPLFSPVSSFHTPPQHHNFISLTHQQTCLEKLVENPRLARLPLVVMPLANPYLAPQKLASSSQSVVFTVSSRRATTPNVSVPVPQVIDIL